MDHKVKTLVASFNSTELDQNVNFLDKGNVIVYCDPSGEIKATRNRCRHRAGRFIRENNAVLTCANHGWKLDLANMVYCVPLGGLVQDELLVETGEDGIVHLYALQDPLPWKVNPKEKELLAPKEFTIRFYTHATVEITCGSKTLFTDPWLTGPSFVRGWWLLHQPPGNWLERLAAADAIYVSHSHSDHLNLPTLKALAAVNPYVPIYFPDFGNDMCQRLLEMTGMRNLNSCTFKTWYPLGEQGRFMMLQDSNGKDDSGILVEYKGHQVLNTTDASANINEGIVPKPVDVLLASFAGGADGHPVCWREQYSDEYIAKIVSRNIRLDAEHFLQQAEQSAAEVIVPFAGYFTEAHPADVEIKHMNRKNSPELIRDLAQKRFPEVQTWIPSPGEVFDIGTRTSLDSPASSSAQPIYEFDKFLEEIRADLNFTPLQDLIGIRKYFEWAGFRGNLILHVIETDENFEEVIREFLVDFANPSLLVPTRSDINQPYLRMRVRADSFRYVLRRGLPWSEISIGFQARFYREPDVYSYDFWRHFQLRLPRDLPDWKAIEDELLQTW